MYTGLSVALCFVVFCCSLSLLNFLALLSLSSMVFCNLSVCVVLMFGAASENKDEILREKNWLISQVGFKAISLFSVAVLLCASVHTWRLFCHYLLLIFPSFGVSERLCFMTKAFHGDLHIFFQDLFKTSTTYDRRHRKRDH